MIRTRLRMSTVSFALVLSVLVLATDRYIVSAQPQINETLAPMRGVSRAFTALTATGQTASFDTRIQSNHTAHVVVTGSPVSCVIRLQGSIDGNTWYDISGSDITCTSTAVQHVADKPSRYVRGNLTTLSGGTSPTVTLVYAGK